ncbi:MAG: hypothetical protein UV74_C0013G0152 [Candidatus Woesebacteria bacterium GW2011_GWB1_43_14]|uniref:Uncharacterized protein n=1 Tax=Candidatus Woesebacteria bacterium GW2011_GWB1_43_14 TaxID=1618578 RepID=A0A0G1DGM6_9BACT|nr:MAG: hypothetical protein UV51_C0005G0069 [Candidatus Woesebacteria bacterium GW2011_GWC1_42_9]KKS97030.1 MAG: hypothetical protein UV74_C0013G0152 [Candidatus Woesebacteria bacterium GW2011_GWB1_43_14]
MSLAVRMKLRFFWGSSNSFRSAFWVSGEARSIFRDKIVVLLVSERWAYFLNSLTSAILRSSCSITFEPMFLVIFSTSVFGSSPTRMNACILEPIYQVLVFYTQTNKCPRFMQCMQYA